MIKRIAAAALAGTAIAVTFAASAATAAPAQEPAPNTGGVTGVPTAVYPNGLNSLSGVNQIAGALPRL
ncbi:hypothetical protein [Embleya sp. AB8]|uniref:hypothetical protein n=1 Tax=Embleya sp. AB8 TaxID=3156304 RepID=UPI003C7604DB